MCPYLLPPFPNVLHMMFVLFVLRLMLLDTEPEKNGRPLAPRLPLTDKIILLALS